MEEAKKKSATLYKGRFVEKGIQFTRVWAMPSPWTFSIFPISQLLKKYVGDGKGWIDPFAGKNSPAEIRNDHNPEREAEYHMEAIDFVNVLTGRYNGILFDPPYSFRQISEHYRSLGMKASQLLWGECGFTKSLQEIVEESGWEEVVDDDLPGSRAVIVKRLKDPNARQLFDFLSTLFPHEKV